MPQFEISAAATTISTVATGAITIKATTARFCRRSLLMAARAILPYAATMPVGVHGDGPGLAVASIPSGTLGRR